MTIKPFLRQSLKSLSGLLGLAFVAAILVLAMGSLISGGMSHFAETLQSAALYLLLLRVTLYAVVAGVGGKARSLYLAKKDTEGARRVMRLLILGAVLALAVELPKLWG